ncbi:hypothetical protein J6590_021008 [Homalodisca vitripennis]|nr:hypothetical protein J6590_021008 [Homalodisca vitripennis]
MDKKEEHRMTRERSKDGGGGAYGMTCGDRESPLHYRRRTNGKAAAGTNGGVRTGGAPALGHSRPTTAFEPSGTSPSSKCSRPHVLSVMA